MAARPFVLARFDWSTGHLVMRMMRGSGWIRVPLRFEGTTDWRKAYRWKSRQAAAQYLKAWKLAGKWEVIDLRQLGWKGR